MLPSSRTLVVQDAWEYQHILSLFRILLLLLGVDRLSAPILSILPIIDIGHFQNRFADNFFFFYNANKHTIYRWHYLLVNK